MRDTSLRAPDRPLKKGFGGSDPSSAGCFARKNGSVSLADRLFYSISSRSPEWFEDGLDRAAVISGESAWMTAVRQHRVGGLAYARNEFRGAEWSLQRGILRLGAVTGRLIPGEVM